MALPTPITNAKFGTTGGVREAQRRYGYTPVEIVAGQDYLEYYSEGQNSFSITLDLYQYSGIARNTGDVGIDSFTAISVAEEEVITGPHKRAADPRTVPAFGDMMVISDYIMITRKTVKTSVTFRGELPTSWAKNKRGTVVGPYSWGSAYGSYSLLSPESFLGEVSESERVTDLDESTAEMNASIASEDDSAQTHLITLEEGVDAYVDQIYQLSVTQSLSPDGSPEKSYSITNFMHERDSV